VIERARLRVVDLAQPLSEATAVWPGGAPLRATVVDRHEDGGVFSRELAFGEHTGTHLDAPVHFHPGGVAVDGIAADDLVCEAAVIDIAAACAADPDYGLAAGDVLAHEAEHGTLPRGIAVLVRTGWSAHLGDPARYVGYLRFPGVSVDAARLLIERGVAGIGIDTLSIDRGAESAFAVHHLTLPAGLWHLEGLVRLDELPPRGALLVIGAPPLAGGSGMPARPLALLPA
jgi:kynurenine formamidase